MDSKRDGIAGGGVVNNVVTVALRKFRSSDKKAPTTVKRISVRL